MEELNMMEIELVSGGLPDTGSQAAIALGGAVVNFGLGFIHGFISAF